jgi:hypothetical protein
VFETVPLPFFLALLQLRVAKHPQLQKLCSTKKVELEASSTFFLEHLKEYSNFLSIVLHVELWDNYSPYCSLITNSLSDS